MLEFMKKDLDEFTSTIQQETSTLVNSTAATLREKLNIEDDKSTANVVKRSVSDFLDTVSNALVVQREEDEDQAIIIKNSEPVILSRLELQLLLLQKDANTYLEEPSDLDDYQAWLATFDLDSRRKELTELLVSKAELRTLYNDMVPSQVSHAVFWNRYFYHVHRILEAEERRLALKKRADRSKNDSELAWDDDEDTSRYNLTSQEADRILDAYQKECEELEAHAKESSNLRSRSEPALASCLTQPSPDQHQTIPENSAPKDNGDVAPQNPSTTGAEKSADVEHRITPTTTQMEPEIQNGEPKEQLSLTSHSSHSSKDESLGEEWEKDFDIGVTEEDVQKVLKQESVTGSNQEDDEWENWH